MSNVENFNDAANALSHELLEILVFLCVLCVEASTTSSMTP